MVRAIPQNSWIHPALHIGPSKIDGLGVFTNQNIEASTIVIRWGGTLFTRNEVISGAGRQHTLVGIGPDLYLGNLADEPPGVDDHMNHSCAPNLGMFDEISLAAIYPIEAGNELTADYAMWLNDPAYVMKASCNCNARGCRTIISGRDFLLQKVRDNIGLWFSPFLKEQLREAGV